MKKLILLLALAIGSTFSAVAQTVFTVKCADRSFFPVLNTEDVNFRRQANSTSGKLMEWSSDGGTEWTETVYFFSDEYGSRYRANSRTGAYVVPFHLPAGYMLNVLGTSGEWYKVDLSAFQIKSKNNSQSAYVMQKFCDKIERGTITDKTICPVDAGYGADGSDVGIVAKKTFQRTSGKYSGLPMAINIEEGSYSEEGCRVTLNFPFFIDNKYIYVIKTDLPVVFSNSVGNNMTIKWVQGEDDEGTYTEPKIFSKPYAENKIEAAITYFFKNISDDNLYSYINKELNRDKVLSGLYYILSTNGKYYNVGDLSTTSANAITRTFSFAH